MIAFEELRRSVASATISAMLRTSLLDKLDAAAAAMDANNRKVACRFHSQFANQVRTQSGRGIPITLADSWPALVDRWRERRAADILLPRLTTGTWRLPREQYGRSAASQGRTLTDTKADRLSFDIVCGRLIAWTISRVW